MSHDACARNDSILSEVGYLLRIAKFFSKGLKYGVCMWGDMQILQHMSLQSVDTCEFKVDDEICWTCAGEYIDGGGLCTLLHVIFLVVVTVENENHVCKLVYPYNGRGKKHMNITSITYPGSTLS